MEKPVKIMHIDPDYKVTFFLKYHGFYCQSLLTVEEAVDLLRSEKIDLIVSEPHNQVILTHQGLKDSSQFEGDEKLDKVYTMNHETLM